MLNEIIVNSGADLNLELNNDKKFLVITHSKSFNCMNNIYENENFYNNLMNEFNYKVNQYLVYGNYEKNEDIKIVIVNQKILDRNEYMIYNFHISICLQKKE